MDTRWVAILEAKEMMIARQVANPGSPDGPQPVGIGIVFAETKVGALVWIPSLTEKTVKPGAQVMTGRSGSVPLIEVTRNLLRDATPEEIEKAGG